MWWRCAVCATAITLRCCGSGLCQPPAQAARVHALTKGTPGASWAALVGAGAPGAAVTAGVVDAVHACARELVADLLRAGAAGAEAPDLQQQGTATAGSRRRVVGCQAWLTDTNRHSVTCSYNNKKCSWHLVCAHGAGRLYTPGQESSGAGPGSLPGCRAASDAVQQVWSGSCWLRQHCPFRPFVPARPTWLIFWQHVLVVGLPQNWLTGHTAVPQAVLPVGTHRLFTQVLPWAPADKIVHKQCRQMGVVVLCRSTNGATFGGGSVIRCTADPAHHLQQDTLPRGQAAPLTAGRRWL